MSGRCWFWKFASRRDFFFRMRNVNWALGETEMCWWRGFRCDNWVRIGQSQSSYDAIMRRFPNSDKIKNCTKKSTIMLTKGDLWFDMFNYRKVECLIYGHIFNCLVSSSLINLRLKWFIYSNTFLLRLNQLSFKFQDDDVCTLIDRLFSGGSFVLILFLARFQRFQSSRPIIWARTYLTSHSLEWRDCIDGHEWDMTTFVGSLVAFRLWWWDFALIYIRGSFIWLQMWS